jgi:hypothetical protein
VGPAFVLTTTPQLDYDPASVRPAKISAFRHSLRHVPLKLSLLPFRQDLPGSILASRKHRREDARMTTVMRSYLGLALVALLPTAVLAQDESAAMDDAIDELEEMAVEVSEFVGDVRFVERDVRSLLDLWDEFSEFDDNDDEDDALDFDAILADS